jgi:uncharacterized membrane protein YkvA (DUF1232 family)
MENVFFQRAFGRATATASKKQRLLRLASQAFSKVQRVEWKGINSLSVKSKITAFGRLSRAYALGYYREVKLKSMILIVAAILYFVNPMDLIPDIIPITGLTDDFAVLLWVYGSIREEIEKFLEWERTKLPVK